MKKIILLMAAIVFLYLGGIAHAINYTVDGWGPYQYPAPTTPPANAPHVLDGDGYPGDTLELQTYTGTLDLTPGTYTQKINTLLWTIDYTYGGTAGDPDAWSNVIFIFLALRSISIGSATGSLSQMGTLMATWEKDYITFGDGLTVSLIVQGYKVDVTPIGIGPIEGTNFSGSNPWVQPSSDVMARFEVTAVPEPATMLLLGSGLLGLWGFRKKFKK